MPRTLPSDLAASIWGGPIRPVFMVRLWWPNPDRWICFHDNGGIWPWDGEDWHGVGRMGRISGLSEGVGIAMQETTLELAAPESQWAAIARDARRIRYRPAKIYLGPLTERYDGLLGDPLCLFDGEMAALAFKSASLGDGSFQSRVQLKAQGLFATVSRARRRADSDPYAAHLSEQQKQWPAK